MMERRIRDPGDLDPWLQSAAYAKLVGLVQRHSVALAGPEAPRADTPVPPVTRRRDGPQEMHGTRS